MIFESFLILLPMIVVVMGGYLVAMIFDISEESLIRVVTDFFMPMLVFYSLYTSGIDFLETLKLTGAVTFVLFVLLSLTFLYCRFFRLDFKAMAPPIAFMNSGFLGIPLMKLWGGLGAMNLIVIYDQVQTFYIFTVGIMIVTGGMTFSGLREMLKAPLLWSIVLGFIFKYSEISIPDSLLNVFRFGGSGAPVLATFALGCSLKKHEFKGDWHLLAGLLFRFVLGFSAALIAVYLFGITGTASTVVLVASSLPSAVFSVVLPLRYGVDARYAGSMVIVSSVLSILVIPLVFYFSSLLG